MDFYEKAKRTAAKADLIITNHAFLISDLIHKDAILPKQGYLIVDEAHHLERAASKQLGQRLDYVSVKTVLNRLGTSEQKQLLYRVECLIANHNLHVQREVGTLNKNLIDFSFEFEQLFYILAQQTKKANK